MEFNPSTVHVRRQGGLPKEIFLRRKEGKGKRGSMGIRLGVNAEERGIKSKRKISKIKPTRPPRTGEYGSREGFDI